MAAGDARQDWYGPGAIDDGDRHGGTSVDPEVAGTGTGTDDTAGSDRGADPEGHPVVDSADNGVGSVQEITTSKGGLYNPTFEEQWLACNRPPVIPPEREDDPDIDTDNAEFTDLLEYAHLELETLLTRRYEQEGPLVFADVIARLRGAFQA